MNTVYIEPAALLFILEKGSDLHIRLRSDGNLNAGPGKPSGTTGYEQAEQDGVRVWTEKTIRIAADRQIRISLKNGLFGRSLTADVVPIATGPGFMGTRR